MNKTNRKLKKLMRDPKLFFKDMYLKNSVKLKKIYTIISQRK